MLNRKPRQEYFEILEIEQTDNYRIAEMAYLRALKKWNPDRYYRYPSLKTHAEIKTREVHEAFTRVSKSLKRSSSTDFATIDWQGYFNEHTLQRRRTIGAGRPCVPTGLNTIKHPIRDTINYTYNHMKKRPIISLLFVTTLVSTLYWV